MTAKGDCRLCGRPRERRTAVALAGPPTLVRCTACDLVSLEPFPTDEERRALYQEDYYEPERGERFLAPLEALVQVFRWLRLRTILRREPGPATLLDVGCGRGALIELLNRRGWRALGTQLSETAARAARERRGLEVVTGELPDIDLEPGSFRVVTLYHVLEHLDRPGLYLERIHELLTDGGWLIVEVPNFASPGFRLLGLRDLCVDYPHHLLFFTPSTLRALLEDHGFEIHAESHFSLEYSPITTLQNLLNALPGRANRLLDALRRNAEAGRLLRQPATWVHFVLGGLLAPLAFGLSLAGLVLPVGNTMRLDARKPARPSPRP